MTSGPITKINRYDHGGGRIFIEYANGTRDLVVDLYEPEERREAIIAAMIAAGIIQAPAPDGETGEKDANP